MAALLDKLKFQLFGRNRSKSLSSDDYHDLVDLWNMRAVTVLAKGRSITEVYVDIENHLDKSLKIILTHGTYLCAKGAHQNMVAREEVVFDVMPGETKYLTVPAACINAERDIPTKNDGFRGVKKVPKTVERFLRESAGSSSNVVQAGVWAITDGYTRDQIRERLITTMPQSKGGGAITDRDITIAKAILDRLEIQTNI